MIDCHVHLVDFRQRLLPQEDLQQAMDESDVSHAVVFGLPVRKKWELSEPQERGYYAASRSWPVSIHQNSSAAGRSLGNEYVDELDGMLARHPSTTVVWCHGGVSPRVGSRRQAELLRDMLDRHRQLHVDLSWSVWDVASTLRQREPEDLDGAWLSLVAAHPDRFVLGSDSVGSVNGMRTSLHRALPLLDGLPTADADLVRQGNAERLWFS